MSIDVVGIYNELKAKHTTNTHIVITCLSFCEIIHVWFPKIIVTNEIILALYNYFVNYDFDDIFTFLDAVREDCSEEEMTLTEYLYSRGYLDYDIKN